MNSYDDDGALVCEFCSHEPEPEEVEESKQAGDGESWSWSCAVCGSHNHYD